jgi:hypothetical protein
MLALVTRLRRSPRRSTSPVRWTPSLNMYIATMVSVAGLAKPEMGSVAEIRVHGSKTTRAVVSLGIRSVTNRRRAPAMSANTRAMPDGAGNAIGGRWTSEGI